MWASYVALICMTIVQIYGQGVIYPVLRPLQVPAIPAIPAIPPARTFVGGPQFGVGVSRPGFSVIPGGGFSHSGFRASSPGHVSQRRGTLNTISVDRGQRGGTGTRHSASVGRHSASGRGRQSLPLDVQRVIGSTIYGRVLRAGEFGLPVHLGAGAGEQFSNGISRGGWDGDPRNPIGAQDPWSSPLTGPPPRNFRGAISDIRHLLRN